MRFHFWKLDRMMHRGFGRQPSFRLSSYGPLIPQQLGLAAAFNGYGLPLH
jgi:hypothetical protein